MKKQIITISREFGSGGRVVGQQLADALGVKYYDKNILDDIAKEKGYSKEMIEEDEKKAKNSLLYSMTNAFGTGGYGPEGLSIKEMFFIAQFDYITKLSQKDEGCVIVGRCADYVLKDEPSVTNVFIHGDTYSRAKRAIDLYGADPDEVDKLLVDIDKARANYYRYHTGQKWGEAKNYHLAIDSTNVDLDKVTELVLKFVELSNR